MTSRDKSADSQDDAATSQPFNIPLSCEHDGYFGPWVLTYMDEGRAGYGVDYGPKKWALFFDSHDSMWEYWDSVKDRPRGVRAKIEAFPLMRPGRNE